MKTKNYCLILSAVTAILSVPVFGETEILREHEPVLFAHPNPSLKGIQGLGVSIRQLGVEQLKVRLVWRELETEVINKLNKAGIRAIPQMLASSYRRPRLTISIDMLKLADYQQYVFRTQTCVGRMAYLTKEESKLGLMAEVWKSEPVMQAVSIKDMPAAVTNVVLEQVDAFIHAYLAANQPGTGVGDVNDVNVALMIAATKRASPAEYKFVASKNSDVFHGPDCSSAKRIKATNLVGYSSREETLKAGKRPCKRCKP